MAGERAMEALVMIYERGGPEYIPSSIELGKMMGITQKNAWKHLRALMRDGYLAHHRGVKPYGTRTMKITKKGKEAVRERRRVQR